MRAAFFFAASRAFLQTVTRAVLPCGVEAPVLKLSRCAWNAVFKGASACGALAATLVRQASYFLIYSSHSATPTESPAGAVSDLADEFDVFAVFEVFAAGVEVLADAVFVLFAVAVLLAVFEAVVQPAKMIAAHRNAAIINTLG